MPNWYREGLHSHGYARKSSGPFQNRSRNWVIWKSGPEFGKIRYHTIQFSCEQKRYDIVLLSEPVWYPRVTPKLTTSDVEVEIRPNCTSLILPIVWSFENRRLTSTVYPLINLIHVNV